MGTNSQVEILERLSSLEKRVRTLESQLLSSSTLPIATLAKKTSAKEFLLSKAPKTAPEQVLVLAYFLERERGIESFNIDDLEAIFREAKERLPTNLNDVVYQCGKRGMVMDAEEKKNSKKAWSLTSTGEAFVTDKLTKTK
jgi:hypothetical protein